MSIPSSAKAVGHVLTADLARSRDYYEKTLGLPLRDEDEYGYAFAVGEALLRVTRIEGYSAGPHPVFGFDVADIRATAQALRDQGVTLTIYEGFGQDALGIWSAPDGKTKLAWFSDPDGNVLSLSQT